MVKNVTEALKHNRSSFILGPLIKMVEAVFDLLIPLFMKAIIDLAFDTPHDPITQGIGAFIVSFGTWIPNNPELNVAIIGGTCILIMGLIGFMTTMICQYIAAKAATSVGTEIRDSLYAKILSLSKREMEGFGVPKLLTILNSDSYQVQQGVLFFIRLAVRAPFIILGSLIISFILDWQIGLIFLGIIPIILAIVFFVMIKASKQYLVIQSKLDHLSQESQDDLEGSRVVRAFSRQDYENQNFTSETAEYKKEAIRVARMNSWINPLTFAVVSLATVGVILLSGLSLKDGVTFWGYSLLPSTIITLVAYLDQIFQTLVLITNLVVIFTKSVVSWKRVDSVFALQPSIQNDPNAVSRTIPKGSSLFAFTAVSLAYEEGGNLALANIGFDLRKGQSLGIIGGTGSGKSSVVSLMERFLDASTGEIAYKGQDIRKYPLESLHQEIGLVPQKSVLFKGTLRSNFLLANPTASDDDITTALKEAQAEEFVRRYSDYLDHPVEEGGRNFSGGQRQRLCIARALLRKPEVLILDDSTSALDLLTDRKVRNALSTDYPSISKVIVSQRVSTVADCDLILVLEGGKIIGKGTHATLLADCPAYRETFESQTQKGEEKA